MAKPKQRIEIKLHPEARRIIENATASGVKQATLAEYAGVEANIISKVLGEDRRLMASEFIDIVQGLGFKIEKPAPAVAPSVRLVQSVLGVIFEHERGAHVPEEVLQDYAIVLQNVCSAVASGDLVETDDRAVRAKTRELLTVLQMKAQAVNAL